MPPKVKFVCSVDVLVALTKTKQKQNCNVRRAVEVSVLEIRL